MRKFAIALSAFAALGLAAPLMTVPAQADAVVIKKHEPVHKKVIIKKRDRDTVGSGVVVREHRPADKKVIIKKHDMD